MTFGINANKNSLKRRWISKKTNNHLQNKKIKV